MRLVGRTAAAVLVAAIALVACGDAPVSGDDDGLTARLQLRRVGELRYDEGAYGYFHVEHDAGRLVMENEFDDSEVADMSIAPAVVPGTYEIRSWMRPCSAACPEDGGALDPPTAECDGEITLAEGDVVHLVVEHEHDEDGDRCTVRVEN